MREVPWPRVVRSVRVRITLAATVATAVAVAAAGWLLVRQVEDTQLGRLADRAEEGVDHVARALALGADDFLSKPFSFVVLVARLRALVRRGGAPRPRA